MLSIIFSVSLILTTKLSIITIIQLSKNQYFPVISMLHSLPIVDLLDQKHELFSEKRQYQVFLVPFPIKKPKYSHLLQQSLQYSSNLNNTLQPILI